MIRRAKARAQRGFTLVEVLVALAVLALVVAFGFTGLRHAADAWAVLDRQGRHAADLGAVQDVLRSLIAGAYPEAEPDGRGSYVVAFQGRGDALDFVARMPARTELPGFRRITLALDDGEGGRRLVLGWAGEPAQGEGAGSTVLVEGVRALRVRYFGDDGSGRRWHEAWSGRKALPALVAMEMDLADGRVWPRLVAAPRIEVDAACTLDLLTRTCAGR